MRIDSHTHLGFDPLYYLQGWSPYAADTTRLLLEADPCGIDYFVVFPFIAYMALDLEQLRKKRIFPGNSDDSIPYRFENQRLCNDLRRCPREVRQRFWPFLIGDPARRPREQVEEWRKLPTDYSVHGLKFQTHTIQSPVLSLLREGACMLDYAAEHNLPIMIHSSVHPGDKWSQCSDILKLVEARPNLRFCLAHSCRFHLPTLEQVASLPNAWFDCASFVVHCLAAAQNLPAVATPDQRFSSNYEYPETVMQDLAAAFPHKLIWGSDAPYYSIEYDRLRLHSSYQREAACFEALPETARHFICQLNPLTWLGHPPP